MKNDRQMNIKFPPARLGQEVIWGYGYCLRVCKNKNSLVPSAFQRKYASGNDLDSFPLSATEEVLPKEMTLSEADNERYSWPQ